ncbi:MULTISPECIES: LysM peptidoglycan-binding domain-containing protein [unclassified Roseitalea]|uniref:LysM peptidoglycan-binding domain-containing protein n=1 Tax=unclassified Roseitalea TaxID=2639107 RepID=UPI00273FA1FB|nr:MULTISPECIES: LysM peptidoglycan-binding domain-containing protein [unclassified Roseitalea]
MSKPNAGPLVFIALVAGITVVSTHKLIDLSPLRPASLPAAGDVAAPQGDVAEQAMPDAPAVAAGEDASAETGDTPADVAATPSAASQVHDLAGQLAPPDDMATSAIPRFDLLRAEPDGSLVIAGTGPAAADMEIIAGARTIARAQAGPTGDFAAVLDEPLAPGDYQIVLRATAPDGVVVTSRQTALVAIPEDGSDNVLALVEEPGTPSRLITTPGPDTPVLVPVVGADEDAPQLAAAPRPSQGGQAPGADRVAGDGPAATAAAGDQATQTTIADAPAPSGDAGADAVATAQTNDATAADVETADLADAAEPAEPESTVAPEAGADAMARRTAEPAADSITAAPQARQEAAAEPQGQGGTPARTAREDAAGSAAGRVEATAEGAEPAPPRAEPAQARAEQDPSVQEPSTPADADRQATSPPRIARTEADAQPAREPARAPETAPEDRRLSDTIVMIEPAGRVADPSTATPAAESRAPSAAAGTGDEPAALSGTLADPPVDPPADPDAPTAAEGSPPSGTAAAPPPHTATPAQTSAPAQTAARDDRPAAETPPAPRRDEGGGQILRIEAVEIDGVQVFVAGAAAPDTRLRVYANDILLGDTVASEGGRFLVQVRRDLPVGDYIIRADAIDPATARVLRRASVPFVRRPGERLAAIAVDPSVRLPAGPPTISFEEALAGHAADAPANEPPTLGGTIDIAALDDSAADDDARAAGEPAAPTADVATPAQPGAGQTAPAAPDAAIASQAEDPAPGPTAARQDGSREAQMGAPQGAGSDPDRSDAAAPPAVTRDGEAPPAAEPEETLAALPEDRRPRGDPSLAEEGAPSQGPSSADPPADPGATAPQVRAYGTDPSAASSERAAARPDGPTAPIIAPQALGILQGPPVIGPDEGRADALTPVDGSVIIRRGDTLWEISRRVYGRGVKYTTIYLANQDQIGDPGRIWPGQVFDVPAEADADAEATHRQLRRQY